MKAVWKGHILAEAEESQLIRIEGNWYFPQSGLNMDYFSDSDMTTTCFWKGDASYYDVTVDGEVNDAAAWYYGEPKAGSIERVGKDFTGYVAFWRGVEVKE